MEFGMSDEVGPINVADQGGRFLTREIRQSDGLSEETEIAIDREVKALLLEARDKASNVLKEHRDDLDELATVLLDQETLSRSDLESYFSGKQRTVELPSGTNV
jgi:cell division protease FtsH